MTAGRAPRLQRDPSQEASWSAATGHPLRIEILRRFVATPDAAVTPLLLADEFGVSIGVVSYHVRTLHRARVIRLVKRVAVRGTYEHRYRLEDPEAVASHLWGLSARLLHAPDADGCTPPGATVLLDGEGLADFQRLTERYLADVAQIGQQSRSRASVAAPVESPPSEERLAPIRPIAILLGGDDVG